MENVKENLMKKFITLLIGVVFCGGCHIPYPSAGVRPQQVVETWEEVCTVKIKKDGEKETRCRWVRTR